LRKGLAIRILFCSVLLAVVCIAAAEEKLGDVTDGSRAVPVHLIPLLDERGEKITPSDEMLMPFSTRQTCGFCHDVNRVVGGWHFNAVDADVPPGRMEQPWILAEPGAATQIPLSYRNWPGVYRPEQVGLTAWKFVEMFGRHLPGGGPGEMLEQSDNPDEVMRAYVSGKLETNCLACHNAYPGQDQAEYAAQIGRQNFRWAAAAACGFASMTGSAGKMPSTYDPYMPAALDDPKLVPPMIRYSKSVFDDKNKVLFDVPRNIPKQRCYFCHTNVDIGDVKPEKWLSEEDVHLAAGLTCVDCHRNSLDHKITRGYEGEPAGPNVPAGAFTCKGCHIGDTMARVPTAGRFTAPVPKHLGIPPIHFDKLTCTACHSGPWPGSTAIGLKTSRAHGLGTHDSNKSLTMLPHLYYPVFAKNESGKIAPHKLFWPAFWGALSGDAVVPLDMDTVRPATVNVIGKSATSAGDWPTLTEEQIAKILTSLSEKVSAQGKAVYVAGGKMYSLDEGGKVASTEHDAAKPVMWPVAHNVRSAAQSLGVRKCEDCHSADSGFFFGNIPIDSPLASGRGVKKMVELENLSRRLTGWFAWSFVFRPWLKVVTLLSSLVIVGVLVLYALKALAFVAKVLVGED